MIAHDVPRCEVKKNKIKINKVETRIKSSYSTAR